MRKIVERLIRPKVRKTDPPPQNMETVITRYANGEGCEKKRKKAREIVQEAKTKFGMA